MLCLNLLAFRGLRSDRAEVLGSKIRSLLLRSKDIWAIALSVAGVNAGYYVFTQFSVTYAEGHLGFVPFLAGAASSLALAGAIFGAPFAGWLPDHTKMKRRRRLVAIANIYGLSVALLLLIPAAVLTTLIAIFCLGFFASAAYSNAYTLTTQFASTLTLRLDCRSR